MDRLRCLQATKIFPLILKTEGKGSGSHIDSSHAAHADMKGHVGQAALETKGVIHSSSSEMKINTASSTESEVVGVGERLPKHLWFRGFRIEQGGCSDEDVSHQDNEAAILVENNGRCSCEKGMRHAMPVLDVSL